jgi:amino acid transporter
MSEGRATTPVTSLSVTDGVAMLIGIVIGVGIFKTPTLIAANVDSASAFIGVWLLGGLITIIGALCYAELGSARPHAGGEYRYLAHAYGQPVGVLFVWARGTVIQTGAIALVAFVYGDYASVLVPLGPYGPAIHATTAVLALTLLNLVGTPHSKRAQILLSSLTVIALLAIAVAGFTNGAAGVPEVPAERAPSAGAIGLAMVFVLLTYGGWNEAAYLAGELKEARQRMARTLLLSTGSVIVLYLFVNIAFLRVFGLEGLRETNAVGADLMKLVAGDTGAVILSFIVCIGALSTLNATIFTGARVYYALGRDLAAIGILGVWDERGHKPGNALVLQCAIALTLVGLGALTRDGFETMVDYTAPVFWLFMLMVAISVIIFRRRDAGAGLHFRAPLYPLTPLLFAAACAWMLYSALVYTGFGSLIGVAVLVAGTPLLWLSARQTAVTPDPAE